MSLQSFIEYSLTVYDVPNGMLGIKLFHMGSLMTTTKFHEWLLCPKNCTRTLPVLSHSTTQQSWEITTLIIPFNKWGHEGTQTLWSLAIWLVRDGRNWNPGWLTAVPVVLNFWAKMASVLPGRKYLYQHFYMKGAEICWASSVHRTYVLYFG